MPVDIKIFRVVPGARYLRQSSVFNCRSHFILRWSCVFPFDVDEQSVAGNRELGLECSPQRRPDLTSAAGGGDLSVRLVDIGHHCVIFSHPCRTPCWRAMRSRAFSSMPLATTPFLPWTM